MRVLGRLEQLLQPAADACMEPPDTVQGYHLKKGGSVLHQRILLTGCGGR